MLVLLHQRDSEFDRARPILAELHSRYPRNFILEMEQATLELRAARPAEALAIYRRILAKASSARDGYQLILRPNLYYGCGLAASASGRYDEAAAFFRASLSHPSASPDTAGPAQLELGKALDLLGRRTEARSAYAQAASSPDLNGSRDLAQRYLRAPFSPRR
jgi:tetratricopeptide (TPR) repeat protein